MLIFGNGGSAADAQHFACELVGRFLRERRALPAIALTTDASTLTAIANDYGFDRVFVAADRSARTARRRRRRHFDQRLVGERARRLAVCEIARVEDSRVYRRRGGPIGAAADVHVNVAHEVTPRVQEVHRTLIHAVCELIESQLDTDH